MGKTSESKDKGNKIIIAAATEEEGQRLVAEMYANPLVTAAYSVVNTENTPELKLLPLMEAMQNDAVKIAKGDLGRIEEMLVVQTQVLHSIFTKAANRMASAEYLSSYQAYSAVAMKAQNLCRMTAATLADMKNPVRATFIKNTAYNQQINVGEKTSMNSSEKNKAESTNELLCEGTDAPMDTEGTSTTSGINSEMEAVGKGRS